ncbi:hypothetical protein, partial [Pseudomonas sp. BN417]|uniref:hypothetical protein n=1 Tax=Pseudomonas sp. BN417 TaxID=2567890 RepID=UPI002454B960
GCRGKPFWFLLGRLPKETRREAKQGLAADSISSLAQDVLATLNADIANSFAMQAAGLPGKFPGHCVPLGE